MGSFLLDLYYDFLEKGHTLEEIDNMDIVQYLEIMVHKSNKDYKEDRNEVQYIDEIPGW